MRPIDRTIRDELNREAARVQIPTDMWENINRRLDEGPKPVELRRKVATVRPAQWKPALAVAAAAGLFWFTMLPTTQPASVVGIPAAQSPAHRASTSAPSSPSAQAEEPMPDNQTRREQKRTVSYAYNSDDRGLGRASLPMVATQR